MNRFSMIFLSVSILLLWLFSPSTIRNNLNSLFSGLAFVAILYSIYEQGRELKETKRHQEMANNASLLELYQVMLDYYSRQKAQVQNQTSDTGDIDDRIKYANKRIDDLLKHVDSKYKAM